MKLYLAPRLVRWPRLLAWAFPSVVRSGLRAEVPWASAGVLVAYESMAALRAAHPGLDERDVIVLLDEGAEGR